MAAKPPVEVARMSVDGKPDAEHAGNRFLGDRFATLPVTPITVVPYFWSTIWVQRIRASSTLRITITVRPSVIEVGGACT